MKKRRFNYTDSEIEHLINANVKIMDTNKTLIHDIDEYNHYIIDALDIIENNYLYFYDKLDIMYQRRYIEFINELKCKLKGEYYEEDKDISRII